jgi:LDH2 family malate/lactate/ureidoglycolate dehydrogenase
MANDHSEDARLVRIDELRSCLAVAFERLQLTPDDAEGLAGLLLDSELRGHRDHGVAALEVLTTLYRDGKLNPRPRVRVLQETDERARERGGMAAAAVRDWQLLVAGPYARLAAEAGMIGFACTNYIPLVAPPGGRTAVLGTNPFAYGLPAHRHLPVVLDVATSVSSVQKVRLAAHQDEPVPEGIILDHAGHPTTDPGELLEGGLMAPLGSPHAPHKGFGLALFIDALGGVLSGAGFARGVPSGAPGNFLWALDVEAFLPREEFLARMDAQIDQIKQGDRLPGVDALMVPGERSQQRYLELTAGGAVALEAASWQILASACESLAVPPPTVLDD